MHQPRKSLSALEWLSQQRRFQVDLPEPKRVLRAAIKTGTHPGTVEGHLKALLTWGVGSALFAGLLGATVSTWYCFCRKRKKPVPGEPA